MRKIVQKMLRVLARKILRKYKPKVIGVTGNVGKTSTREAIVRVLGGRFRVRSASKNFNNEFGLPLSILGEWEKTGGMWFWIRVVLKGWWISIARRPYPEVLVLEYGIDRPGDMEYLLDIVRPDIGIFTALEGIPVHVEFFTDREAVVIEKRKLIQALPTTGFGILNADNDLVRGAGTGARAHVLSFGFSEQADMRIQNFKRFFDGIHGGISFHLSYGKEKVPVVMEGILGRAGGYVASAAALTGLVMGMELSEIAKCLGGVETPLGRGRLMQGIKHSMVIDDTYNASPASMREALETLQELDAVRKVCVLGDMLELGKFTLEAHEEVGRMAKEVCDVLVTVGVRGKIIAEAAVQAGMSRRNTFSFMNIREAGMQVQQKIRKGDLILVKGSQGVRMERVVKEIMAEPGRAGEFLVRQNPEWLKKSGLYD